MTLNHRLYRPIRDEPELISPTYAINRMFKMTLNKSIIRRVRNKTNPSVKLFGDFHTISSFYNMGILRMAARVASQRQRNGFTLPIITNDYELSTQTPTCRTVRNDNNLRT